MTRKTLRAQFRTLRQSLSPGERQQHSQAALAHLIASELLAGTASVGLFVSTEEEFDTAPLIAHCLAAQIGVALPAITDRATGAMELRWHRSGHALQRGSLGIPEPAADAGIAAVADIGLLFMPLVAFDASGSRLGMGGGYYDRLLGTIEPADRPLLIGLAHEIQRSATPLATEHWDVGLDLVLTEAALSACSARGRSSIR